MKRQVTDYETEVEKEDVFYCDDCGREIQDSNTRVIAHSDVALEHGYRASIATVTREKDKNIREIPDGEMSVIEGDYKLISRDSYDLCQKCRKNIFGDPISEKADGRVSRDYASEDVENLVKWCALGSAILVLTGVCIVSLGFSRSSVFVQIVGGVTIVASLIALLFFRIIGDSDINTAVL